MKPDWLSHGLITIIALGAACLIADGATLLLIAGWLK